VLNQLFEPQPERLGPAEEEEPSQFSYSQEPIYITSSPLPTPLLHTSHESRTVAQKHCVLSFVTSSSPPRVYFNSALDTLYLPYWSFTEGSSEFASLTTASRPVQHVAFDLDKWYYSSDWLDDHLNYQIEPLQWPGLKSVTFLLRKPNPGGLCSCLEELERPEVLGGVGFVELEGEERVWVDNARGDCERALKKMREENDGWEPPAVVFKALARNGVRV
jgi:hypothetical protein